MGFVKGHSGGKKRMGCQVEWCVTARERGGRCEWQTEGETEGETRAWGDKREVSVRQI